MDIYKLKEIIGNDQSETKNASLINKTDLAERVQK